MANLICNASNPFAGLSCTFAFAEKLRKSTLFRIFGLRDDDLFNLGGRFLLLFWQFDIVASFAASRGAVFGNFHLFVVTLVGLQRFYK